MALGFEWNFDMDIIGLLFFFFFARDHWFTVGGQTKINDPIFQGMLDCWLLEWKHWNSIVFGHKQRNLEYCIYCFKEHFDMIIQKATPSLKEGMQSWLDSL